MKKLIKRYKILGVFDTSMNRNEITTNLPRLSNKHVIAISAISLIVSLILSADTTSLPFYYLGIILVIIVLLSLTILPKRFLIYPIFILIINMSDLTQASLDEEYFGQILTASAWQFKIGPITPAIFVFAFLLIVCLRLFKVNKKKFNTTLFVYFIVIATAISFLFGFPLESVSRTVTDAKVPMFFCIGLLIFSSYYIRYPHSILITSQVLFALLVGHFILDFIYLFLGVSKTMASGYKNVSIDSGKGLVTLIFFFALGNLINKQRIFINIIITLTSFYLLLSYQTRWLIVTLVIGLIVVSTLLGLRKVIKVFIPLILLSILTIPIFILVLPDVWEAMQLRFSSIESINYSSTLTDVDIVRAASIYNSTDLLWEKHTLLTGMGYGSWYSDKFFPITSFLDSFDTESLNVGKFYRVHDFVFHFLFKFGILGLSIYIFSFLKPLRKIWKMRHAFFNDKLNKLICIIIFGSSTMVITYMYFTGKGLLFSALFVVLSYEWLRIFQSRPNNLQRKGN